jgi:hypothetical protein
LTTDAYTYGISEVYLQIGEGNLEEGKKEEARNSLYIIGEG